MTRLDVDNHNGNEQALHSRTLFHKPSLHGSPIGFIEMRFTAGLPTFITVRMWRT